MDQERFLAPPIVKVAFDVSTVYNILESLRELHEPSRLSGFGAWVVETAQLLDDAKLETNKLVFDLFYPILWNHDVERDFTDFGTFIDTLAAQDASTLRDSAIRVLATKPHKHSDWWGDAPKPTAEALLSDPDVLAPFLAKYIECDNVNHQLVDRAVELYNNPPAMLDVIINHLRDLWENYMREEWERVLPMLQESVNAYRQMEYQDLTALEAIRAVTGRDMSAYISANLEYEQMIFVPSAHIGPYVARFASEKSMYIIFGARLPRGAMTHSSALSRSELLVRLNALSDDVRLRILELLTKNEEMCAQDIIEELGISQSSVSRHLSQLSATGYITERRREVAKCYTLNTDRVVDTIRALTNFLSRG